MEGLTLPLRLQLPQDPTEAAILRRLLGWPMSATSTAAAPPAPPRQPQGVVGYGSPWPDAGGIFVGTAPAMLGLPARHLIVSTAEEKLQFGPYDHDVAGATSHVDGAANTEALLADGDEHPAARWAANYRADGHDNFHLPSRMDLLFAYLHAPQVFNSDGWYWSSTQASRNLAFAQHFATGYSGWDAKGNELRVRAFRWIPLAA